MKFSQFSKTRRKCLNTTELKDIFKKLYWKLNHDIKVTELKCQIQ